MPTENASIFTLAKFGELDVFERSYDSAKLNHKSEYGSGLLHYAISGRKFEIASFLMNQGIDVNMVNSDGQTALHLICANQNLSVADLLLQKGANVNIRDKYGNNPLWTAVFNCKGERYDMVELLLKYNPDVLSKNKAGRSPLDFAMQVGNKKLIDILTKK